MRLPLLAIVALLATAGLVRPAFAEGVALVQGGGLVERSPDDDRDSYPLIPYRPVFPPNETIAVVDLRASYQPGAVQMAATETDAAAPAAEAGRPKGEPILNGDYWLGYPLAIPRIFTAPLRFDTSDWIKTGAFFLAAGGAYLIDEHVNRFFHDHRSSTSDSIAAVGYRLGDSKTILIGSVGGYILGYGIGAMNNGDDYRIRETSLLVLQSFALSELIAEGTKKLAGRQRPSSTDDKSKFDGPSGSDKSFFSGHVVNAFSTASVIAEQYDDVIWVAPVAYSLAGLVAWSRLNDNAHWASDVVVGAGVGYAIGKLVTHFSPFREGGNMTASALPVAGGSGLQLGFKF